MILSLHVMRVLVQIHCVTFRIHHYFLLHSTGYPLVVLDTSIILAGIEILLG